jgi:prepilin-type processing-associated H-X9-DG protein
MDGQLLCPSNPLRGPEKLNELLGYDTSNPAGKDGVPIERLDDGLCGLNTWGGYTGGGGPGFGGTDEKTAERAALVSRAFLDKGYNSNYAAGWHLARSVPKLYYDKATSPVGIFAVGKLTGSTKTGLKGINTTQGPLTRRVLETSPVVSSNVALLGDAAPGDINEAILEFTLGHGPKLVNNSSVDDPWALANNDTTSRTYIQQGSLLSEAFNDGPAYFNSSNNRVSLMHQAANLSKQVEYELRGSIPSPTGAVGNNAYLQDTRDWYALHGGGKKSSCNILMADGSVKEFSDLNNDKFLNPGFAVPTGMSEDQYAVIGYRGPEVELPPGQIFNGVFLLNLQKHSQLEE